MDKKMQEPIMAHYMKDTHIYEGGSPSKKRYDQIFENV